MTINLKKWVGLGLGTAALGAGLTGCDGEQAETDTAEERGAETEVAMPMGEMGEGERGEGEGGEGGEGEGGVSIDAAATDPVVFTSALAIAEAHVIAARDAYAEGETQAAAAMFAHPVSEVLADLEPILEERGVEDFQPLLIDASTAVREEESVEEINRRADDIISALNAAAEKAPGDGSSDAEIAAGVAADQIDRAADMYRIAGESERYDPYLDGYGFYKSAQAAFQRSESEIEAGLPEAATAIRETLALLEEAYPTAVRPAELDADPRALTAGASRVLLAVGS